MSEPEIQRGMENKPEVSELPIAWRAMRLAEDYPLAEALQNLAIYAPDATDPAETLISIHVRYDWPPEQVASVLLAVDQLDKPPQVMQISVPAADDSQLPPLNFELSDGRRATSQAEETLIEIPVEAELPDGWNGTYPHTPAELQQRIQLIQDVALYFATGAGLLMQERSPYHVIEAGRALEPFERYAASCTEAFEQASRIHGHIEALQQHRRNLQSLLAAGDDSLQAMARLAIDPFLELLEGLREVTPKPPLLRRIPTREIHASRWRDQQQLEVSVPAAKKHVEQRAEQAIKTLKEAGLVLRRRYGGRSE